MGHPSAAYELPPEEQARLLGWLYARADKSAPKKKGSQIRGVDAFKGHWATED
jgi:hypothetical protein